MLRSLAPVGLIPAAWLLSYTTLMVPSVDTFLLRGMHLFMLAFLAVFSAVSWSEMEGDVLRIWRKVIVAGVLFTAAGTAGFFLPQYAPALFSAELAYWILAPGYALYASSELMEEHSGTYRRLAAGSGAAFVLLIAGMLLGSDPVTGASFLVVGAVQTASIYIAFRMDSSA